MEISKKPNGINDDFSPFLKWIGYGDDGEKR